MYLYDIEYWVTSCGSIPLNIHELWPRPKRGVGYRQKKSPVDHFIGHMPLLLKGDKRLDIINQNQECL